MSQRHRRAARKRRLRFLLRAIIAKQGFRMGPQGLLVPRARTKAGIRKLHAEFRRESLETERDFISKWYPRLKHYFASGVDVDPERVQPTPILLSESTPELNSLFRLASFWWSVPVSRGFGRRLRFVIIDKSNGKLMGLLGLTDPVFNLRVRDNWVGWDVGTRERRLRHVMDAYVLGAVPPYNQLLGAKPVALIAVSDFVRRAFLRRYAGTRSLIKRKRFDGRLAMITATSALGRSSIYNRLRFDGKDVFACVGMTEGYGHFHVANGTFQELHAYLRSIRNKEIKKYKFGEGPNYRIRVVRTALEKIGLSGDLLRHGVRREAYVAPLAANTAEFLRGEAKALRWQNRPLDGLVQFWRERWMLPRAMRDQSYREFDSSEWAKYLGFD